MKDKRPATLAVIARGTIKGYLVSNISNMKEEVPSGGA